MSKKLEGNGLWESSRMMLPQHKEQSKLIQNDTPALASGPASRKEMEIIRDSIILPVALEIVEKQSLQVESSSAMLKLLYAAAAKILAGHIRDDVRKSQKVLVERKIRVFAETKDDAELIYRYMCRGYEDRLVITKEYMRAEISARIGRYAGRLVTMLRKAASSK